MSSSFTSFNKPHCNISLHSCKWWEIAFLTANLKELWHLIDHKTRIYDVRVIIINDTWLRYAIINAWLHSFDVHFNFSYFNRNSFYNLDSASGDDDDVGNIVVIWAKIPVGIKLLQIHLQIMSIIQIPFWHSSISRNFASRWWSWLCIFVSNYQHFKGNFLFSINWEIEYIFFSFLKSK